jgi:endonuclease-3
MAKGIYQTPANARRIISTLKKAFPRARIALKFENPLELLVSTVLSAQCTDERVNKVTASLFEKYRTPADYAHADLKTFEQEIRSTGFYHNKAKNIIAACKMIESDFNSKVPDTMEGLLRLPGVARKTANIVLYNAYGVTEGIAVDTHVRRVSGRLGLTQNEDPDKIEKDLMDIVPEKNWGIFSYLLIDHGRKICQAKKPLCPRCTLGHGCPSKRLFYPDAK